MILKKQFFLIVFFSENIFKSCCFDESVLFSNTTNPLIFGLMPKAIEFSCDLKNDHISCIYRGIKDGYLAGEIFNMARYYLYKQYQAYTRLNSTKKIGGYLWEFAAGYGLKPVRVLFLFGLIFGLSLAWFSFRLDNTKDALLLSAGAILTFGAKADVLEKLPLLDQAIYIASAFLGVSLVALFVTVLASILLKDN